jgi:hypothetical protein
MELTSSSVEYRSHTHDQVTVPDALPTRSKERR